MNKYSEFARELEQRVSASEAAALYGIELNRRGFAKCPFHAEKTASFYAKGSFFSCYGCGWHGNAIDFVRDYYGMTFIEELNKVNNDFRVGLPLERKATIAEQRALNKAIAVKNLEYAIREARDRAKWDLLATWIDLDKDKVRLAPASPDEPYNDKYVNAVKKIDYIGYLLDNYTPPKVVT